MLLAAGSAISLGSSTPRLVFGQEQRPAGDGVGQRGAFPRREACLRL